MRIRIQEQRNLPKLTNKPEYQLFIKAAVPYYLDMLYDLHIKYIFHAKLELIEKAKSGQHTDPHWFGSIDPDPH
jgi:hypothetical protein